MDNCFRRLRERLPDFCSLFLVFFFFSFLPFQCALPLDSPSLERFPAAPLLGDMLCTYKARGSASNGYVHQSDALDGAECATWIPANAAVVRHAARDPGRPSG